MYYIDLYMQVQLYAKEFAAPFFTAARPVGDKPKVVNKRSERRLLRTEIIGACIIHGEI